MASNRQPSLGPSPFMCRKQLLNYWKTFTGKEYLAGRGCQSRLGRAGGGGSRVGKGVGALMSRISIRIGLLLLIAGAGGVAALLLNDQVLSVENVRENRAHLLLFVGNHYLPAVLSFVALYGATALFLPGALALTVAGGLMFGAVPAAIYANVGATIGASIAFIAARSLLGHFVQERFKGELARFNREMANHGPNYLLVLRIVPVAPFFVINYCAAMTKIPLKTFVWTTSAGMLPGALIYAFIGEQLRHLEAASDLLSGKVMLAMGLLAVFALTPVILHHWPTIRKKTGK